MHNNKEELLKELIKERANDELEPDILVEPLWQEMVNEHIKNSVEKKEAAYEVGKRTSCRYDLRS